MSGCPSQLHLVSVEVSGINIRSLPSPSFIYSLLECFSKPGRGTKEIGKRVHSKFWFILLRPKMIPLLPTRTTVFLYRTITPMWCSFFFHGKSWSMLKKESSRLAAFKSISCPCQEKKDYALIPGCSWMKCYFTSDSVPGNFDGKVFPDTNSFPSVIWSQ